MRESNTPPLALNPMPQELFLAGPEENIPGLRFGVLSTPSNARGTQSGFRVSCRGLGPAEMPFPKAGWVCLWGSFYLHTGMWLCPYRQPRSEGNVNTDGRAGNAAAQGHPHRDGDRHHPVLQGLHWGPQASMGDAGMSPPRLQVMDGAG